MPLGGGDIPVPTLDGKILGTPQYMAPEQIDHPSDVDHRADIYALGVVFYQMLTGELPGKELRGPSKKVHIDVRLDEIVLRAMEKTPELRYQQASAMKTRVNDLESALGEMPQKEQESTAYMSRLTPIMILVLGSGGLGLICHIIWLLLGHKDSFVPTIFVFCVFGIGLIALAIRPGPKRFMISTAAFCTVLATLGFIIYVHHGGVFYPASSLSSAYKAPAMGRIEFKFTHPESMGGKNVSYDVKMWGDTQWQPSSGMSITLKDGQSLRVKSRVNATNPEAPVAMVTTSSDSSNWETKESGIYGDTPQRQLVFSNGLRVEIHWTPMDLPRGGSKSPDPIQQQVMLRASIESDRMHPVKEDTTKLSEPPKLRFIGLQFPNKEIWHGDGSPVTDPQELALIREIGPNYVGDLSKGETIRGMDFWFSHPLFESWDITEFEFLDESGAFATKPGSVNGDWTETRRGDGRLGWSVKTLAVNITHPLNFRLNYTVGPLERVQEHIVEPHSIGSGFRDGNTVITSVGQTAGGQAFLGSSSSTHDDF